MALALGYIQVTCFKIGLLPDVSSDYAPFIVVADANQCMRVSSALEAGTVSDLAVTSRDVLCSNGDPPAGVGEPIQHLAQ